MLASALRACLAAALILLAAPLSADVLFTKVRIFDGTSDQLSPPSHVLVRGNLIEWISPDPIDGDLDSGVTVIDGEGSTLMPGLIDAHWHASLVGVTMLDAMTADPAYVHIVGAVHAEKTLMRGFTTVRDLGGPVFGLKRAIDEGLIPGPRIHPAGAMISQTGGHADFRLLYELPRAEGDLTHTERMGAAAIADSPDEVRRSVREQLMRGASHIKLMAGGGVSSLYDPLDVTQYTRAEMEAAVEAAENWGTFVTVHAYTPRAIRMAIEAGVRCVEHGQLIDEETAALMAEHDVWWSLQPFLDDEYANPQTGEARLKQLEVSEGTERAYNLAREHGIRVAWGTDMLFNPRGVANHGAQLAKMTRWYTPAEALRMATADNAELLQLAGPRNPYAGRVGVVEEGALADLLLVAGDPLENINLVADPDRNFLVIMKDGVIYRNIAD